MRSCINLICASSASSSELKSPFTNLIDIIISFLIKSHTSPLGSISQAACALAACALCPGALACGPPGAAHAAGPSNCAPCRGPGSAAGCFVYESRPRIPVYSRMLSIVLMFSSVAGTTKQAVPTMCAYSRQLGTSSFSLAFIHQ